MKRILKVALTVAALLGATAAQAQKKTLTIGMGSADAGKLDPHIASTTPDKGLLQYLFNGLVRIRPGQISPDTIEPDLAESWISNTAGTEWVFKIRHGVQCHAGYGEFTADDAVYSLKRAASKATSSYSNDFSGVDKVEAIDRWGRRPFAYEVNHKREGYYVVIEFSAGTQTVSDLDRMLGLADEIVRHKIVRLPETKLGATAAPAAS